MAVGPNLPVSPAGDVISRPDRGSPVRGGLLGGGPVGPSALQN
jgi:hypothetical protein